MNSANSPERSPSKQHHDSSMTKQDWTKFNKEVLAYHEANEYIRVIWYSEHHAHIVRPEDDAVLNYWPGTGKAQWKNSHTTFRIKCIDSFLTTDFMQTTKEGFTDKTPMPFGKYKGTAMANVPAPYLLWLHNAGCDHDGVRGYINDNLEVLLKENAKIPKR